MEWTLENLTNISPVFQFIPPKSLQLLCTIHNNEIKHKNDRIKELEEYIHRLQNLLDEKPTPQKWELCEK